MAFPNKILRIVILVISVISYKKSYDNVKNINNVYAYIEMYRNSKKFVGMRL